MTASVYTMFQIISDFFGMFYIARFMNAFIHSDNKRKSNLYCLLYLTYPTLTIFSLFLGNLPGLNVFINIISLFIISFRYKCSLEKRIISVGLIFFIMLITDIICAVLGNTLNASLIAETPYKSITSLVICNLIIYMISILFEKAEISKKDVKIPYYIWGCFTAVPLLSIVSVLITIQINTAKTIHITALFLILLSINVISFFVYDSIIEIYEERIGNISLKEEKEYYRKQCIYMQESEKELFAFRHDISNQLDLIKKMSHNTNSDQINESVAYLEDKLKSAEMFSNTHNIIIDSILNMKYTEIKNCGISVNCKCRVPCKLNIEPMDLMVIIGNLLDNAICAAEKVNDNKYIGIQIIFESGMIYIKVENTYIGKLNIDDKRFLTTKSNKAMHGFGLSNVKKTVKKYHGSTKFNYTANLFTSEVILYLE